MALITLDDFKHVYCLYLAEISNALNEINGKLQEQNKNKLTAYYNIIAFKDKLKLWPTPWKLEECNHFQV